MFVFSRPQNLYGRSLRQITTNTSVKHKTKYNVLNIILDHYLLDGRKNTSKLPS